MRDSFVPRRQRGGGRPNGSAWPWRAKPPGHDVVESTWEAAAKCAAAHVRSPRWTQDGPIAAGKGDENVARPERRLAGMLEDGVTRDATHFFAHHRRIARGRVSAA